MSIDMLFIVVPYAATFCFVAALVGSVLFGQRAFNPPREEHVTIRRVIVRALAPLGEAIAGFARDLSDQLGARGRNLLWPEED
jgi:hypothetical protein